MLLVFHSSAQDEDTKRAPLNSSQLPPNVASHWVALLLLRRIRHGLLGWWSRGGEGALETWEKQFARANSVSVLPVIPRGSWNSGWTERAEGRNKPIFFSFFLFFFFSSLLIFFLNTMKFLVCFMVFPCVENISHGNLNTKMSTRISSTLETSNLIFSFADTWTAKVTKMSGRGYSRVTEESSYGSWTHLWPWWRWLDFRRSVEPWHHLSLPIPLWLAGFSLHYADQKCSH